MDALKKVILVASLAAWWQLSYADTCPSVSDIKNDTLVGWKAYDSDEGTPLSASRTTAFRNSVAAFVLAEWVDNKQKAASMHCYYRDNTGSSLEAYLAKDNFLPNQTNKFWYKVSGYWHCAAGMDKCIFEQKKSLSTTRLAKK